MVAAAEMHSCVPIVVASNLLKLIQISQEFPPQMLLSLSPIFEMHVSKKRKAV